ncbi:MAG: hypothetical protein ACLFRD_12560 [Nitriliruptoraceae bacterium]
MAASASLSRGERNGARGPGSSPGRVAALRMLVVGAALLLVACGGDDADDVAIDDDGVDAADEAEDVDSAEEDVDTQATDDADDGAEDEQTDAGDEDGDGIPDHRPPQEAQPDCDTIDDESPGASISFPSSEEESWQQAGPGPVTVEVVGCSNTFEANLQYEAYHGEDSEPTLEGHTSGGSLGDWAAFSFEETYWTPGDWRVVVFELDAESGDRVEYDEQTFTVDED